MSEADDIQAGLIVPPTGVTKFSETEERLAGQVTLNGPRFDRLIEKHGGRVAWSRVTVCPCAPLNAQTRQPDPRCIECAGAGLLYFGPDHYLPPAAAGHLDPIQERILRFGPWPTRAVRLETEAGAARDTAPPSSAAIRALIFGVEEKSEIAAKPFGRWAWGQSLCTVRAENTLAYLDRITHLDVVIAYSQVVEPTDFGALIPLRYFAVGVNSVFVSPPLDPVPGKPPARPRRMSPNGDFALDRGALYFRGGREPPAGSRLSVHFLCHPTWVVSEHPHVTREEPNALRIPSSQRLSPAGNPQRLPIRALLKLEFIGD